MARIDRTSDEYLIKKADEAINELVHDKVHLYKAYNYYSGIRDRDQFKHLEENYGLGNPTSVKFTPLVRKHVDALVGEFLTLPIKPKVSCKDQKTLSNIIRDKQLYISNEITKVLKSKLENLIYSLIKGDGKNKFNDAQIELELKNVQDSAENNFISEYEKAAQNIVQYLLQSKEIDFKHKLKQLLLDLFIAGEVYYKAEPSSGNTNIELKVLNPLNVFPDKNVNSPYINDSYRIVYREYLSEAELLVKYGKDLKKDDIKNLEKAKLDYNDNNVRLIIANNSKYGCAYDSLYDGLESGVGITPNYSYSPHSRVDLYEVFEVEWIDYDFDSKKNRIENRYRVVKIGGDTYILYGKDDSIIRSIDKPNECRLSINGLHYVSRTGMPYSLIIATKDLQNRYDVLQFFKESVIAQSGTAGDWVDLAHIPYCLGTELEDRLQKWIAYKKSGLALIDSSQEGVQMMNTTFNGYDDTIKLQTIQAIDLAIQDIENTVTSITGVFRERLGGVQPRDAVANVEMSMQQSYIITKQYYQTMDILVREMIIDCLNIAKKVYKNGISGTLILGKNYTQLFTALPEHYSFTDFDIHIADSQELIKEQEQIKQLTLELVKGGQLDPELLVAVSTSESLTDMRDSINKSVKLKKEENNQLVQLQKQLEEAQKQLQDTQKELQKAQNQLQQFDQAKLQMEKDKINREFEIKNKQLEIDKDYKDGQLERDTKRLELEALQLVDNNQRNDDVRYY